MRNFKTLAEMESFYYGDINADMIKKAKDHLLIGDTAYQNKIYGAKVWSQLNYEANAFAGLPKEPWGKTGWRIETAAGDAFPSGGIGAGSAEGFYNIADSTHPTWASVSASPKLIDHGFGMAWETYVQGGSDDTIPITELRRGKGLNHTRAISAYLVQDVDTVAGTGFESLDRVCSSSDEAANASATSTDPDIYGYTRTGGAFDSQVSSSGTTAATLRDLNVSLIDGVWNSITKAGGLPDRIFTGYNTLKVWSALLEAERRFNVPDILGSAWMIPRVDGASAVTPGTEVGFNVATYFGVPIIPCQDYDSSIATARTSSGEVAPILFIDSRFVRVAMKMPTVYVESKYPGDTINIGGHGMEGHYYTIGELRCYNFSAQGKLRDIK